MSKLTDEPSRSAMTEEAIPMMETFANGGTVESLMLRAFRTSNYHRAKDLGDYDVEKLASDFENDIRRGAKEFLDTKSGGTKRLMWTNLLIEFEEKLFCHIRIKSGGYGNNTDQYDVVVMGEDRARVDLQINELRETYRIPPDDEVPGFFLLGSNYDPTRNPLDRVPIREKSLMSDEGLELHYGEGFSDWADRFIVGLDEAGLSILRGDPGTGKTSFLRHIISRLEETHRFYYVPPEAYGMLSSNEITDLWKGENQRYPEAVKVMVIEDAEMLLMDRELGSHGAISTILNLTDGFMGDLVKIHIVCTLNCDVDNLDDAVLRPGRQKFFREFPPLSFSDSKRLADSLGVGLEEERPHTLAEIYHSASQSELFGKPKAGQVGFVAQ